LRVSDYDDDGDGGFDDKCPRRDETGGGKDQQERVTAGLNKK
jgi:hypothetical protein